MRRKKSPLELLTFYGSALLVCFVIGVAALVKGSYILGVVLLAVALAMGGIYVSRRETG